MLKKYIIILIFMPLLSMSQQVSHFAGLPNPLDGDPESKFNNSSSAPDSTYFYFPRGMAFDKNGKFYVSDMNKVRVLHNGRFYNRSGNYGPGSSSHSYKNGTGIVSGYYEPAGLVSDASSNLYIVDKENHAIRKLAAFVNIGNGQVASTFAGAAPTPDFFGTPGFVNATGTSARFDTPQSICSDAAGNFYVTDFNNNCIRKITPAGVVTTLAGSSTGEFGFADGTGTAARFNGPIGICIYDANYILVTDNLNFCIRKVQTTTGATTTLCGNKDEDMITNGNFTTARFASPKGIVLAAGKIYVCDKSTIRVIDVTASSVGIFAGSATETGNTNGNGINARFTSLEGIAYDGQSTIYVTDVYNMIIKKVTINELAPSANFSATKNTVLINENTTLTNTSGGQAATSLQWTISPNTYTKVTGTETTSPFTIKLNNTGFYNVTLTVTNAYGNDSKTVSAFFNVSNLGIKDLEKNYVNINVYPNPSFNNIDVESSGDYKFDQIIISDIKGQIVYQSKFDILQKQNIDISKYKNGMYFIQLSNATDIARGKFIKF